MAYSNLWAIPEEGGDILVGQVAAAGLIVIAISDQVGLVLSRGRPHRGQGAVLPSVSWWIQPSNCVSNGSNCCFKGFTTCTPRQLNPGFRSSVSSRRAPPSAATLSTRASQLASW